MVEGLKARPKFHRCGKKTFEIKIENWFEGVNAINTFLFSEF